MRKSKKEPPASVVNRPQPVQVGTRVSDVPRWTPERRLAEIARIIEIVDHRALSADGPATKTRHEMTDDDLRRIYKLAKGTI